MLQKQSSVLFQRKYSDNFRDVCKVFRISKLLYWITFVLSVIRNLVSISQKNEPLLVSQITDL